MKILFCRWNVVGEEDMIDSLRELGHDVEVYIRPIDSVDYDLDYVNNLSDKLQRNSYACLFTNNFIPVISRVCKIFSMPYLSWTVDCPAIMLDSETLSNTCNYVFLFDRKMYEKYSVRSPGHIFYMPLGANVDRMDRLSGDGGSEKKYGADVSFLGSLYYEKSKYNMVCTRLSDFTRGYCDALIEAQLLVYGESFLYQAVSQEFAANFFEEAGIAPVGEDYILDKRSVVADDILALKCTQEERVRLLSSIAGKFSLDLYTKRDAGKVPGASYKGTADYFNEMPLVFRNSKINLNFTSRGIQSGIPLRIFDIMGAGGFCISNYQPELSNYFEIGRELVVFESEKDLLHKIAYYLKHEDERREIADNGYKKIKASFCMRHRMEDIIGVIGELWA